MKIVNIPEGANAAIGITSLVYDPTNTSQTCVDTNASMVEQPVIETTEATEISHSTQQPLLETTLETKETTNQNIGASSQEPSSNPLPQDPLELPSSGIHHPSILVSPNMCTIIFGIIFCAHIL
jgi:hypothetical protein